MRRVKRFVTPNSQLPGAEVVRGVQLVARSFAKGNCGLQMRDHGIDATQLRTFLLQNRLADS